MARMVRGETESRTKVNAVRASGQRDIDTRIHQNARTVRVGQREYAAHQGAQIARAQILLAYLNPFHAFRKRAFYKVEQGFECRRRNAGL